MIPGGGFRGYGASQTTFAIECAMDDVARLLGMGSFEIRRKNMIRPGDWMQSIWPETSDIEFGSYGLDQCMDLVEKALASGRGAVKPAGDEWVEGTGMAMAMLESGPPTEHRSGAEMVLRADGTYHLAVGSTEMGNGSVTSHRQLAAAVLGSRANRIEIVNADTDLTPYDTGTFASTGNGGGRPGGGPDRGRLARQHHRLRQPPYGHAGRRLPRGRRLGVCKDRRIALAISTRRALRSAITSRPSARRIWPREPSPPTCMGSASP